jgi:hypothetical protein
VSRLTTLLALACVLHTKPVRAENTKPVSLTVEANAGYAYGLTRGVQHLGLGVGPGLSLQAKHWRLSLRTFQFAGETVAAKNEETRYFARYRSFSAQLGASYPFLLGEHLLLAPGFYAGSTVAYGQTVIGKRIFRESLTDFQVGLEASALVRISRFQFGILTQAAFVPTHAAGPLFSAYATFGTRVF